MGNGPCGFCGIELPEARKGKRFCDDKCRWNYHNKKKLDAFQADLMEAMMGVLKKYGYIK